MTSTKVGIRDVLSFFQNASMDIVEIAQELIEHTVTQRRAKSASLSANLKKARAAKGKGKNAKVTPPVSPVSNLATDEMEVRPPSLRARHAGEPAAHAQAATVGAVAEG